MKSFPSFSTYFKFKASNESRTNQFRMLFTKQIYVSKPLKYKLYTEHAIDSLATPILTNTINMTTKRIWRHYSFCFRRAYIATLT